MAPRSQLEITTSSVIRLVKEEASYHNELIQQGERIKKLESAQGGEDENQEYLLKQEVCPKHVVSHCYNFDGHIFNPIMTDSRIEADLIELAPCSRGNQEGPA